MTKIRTHHQWIALLAQSDVIAAMRLEKQIDDDNLDTDASNLANHDAHTHQIIKAVERLISKQAASLQNVAILLKGIIRRDTYG